jgi:hypothetical protein
MYLFCNSRIHIITLYSGHVCVYYASMLRCWHLVWILVRTDHPYLGVGRHSGSGSQGGGPGYDFVDTLFNPTGGSGGNDATP